MNSIIFSSLEQKIESETHISYQVSVSNFLQASEKFPNPEKSRSRNQQECKNWDCARGRILRNDMWTAALFHYFKQGQRHQVIEQFGTLHFHSYYHSIIQLLSKMFLLKVVIIILFLNN